MAKIADVQEVSLEKLRPYERNAKIHDENQVEKIAESIKEFGFISPCLIDEENNIIAGHGRVMAAKKLGLETVPCVYIEGLTEAQRRVYILADNKLTEMGGWDKELISSELEGISSLGFDIGLTGFSIDDILFDEDMGAEYVDDEIEETLNGETNINQGEIWQLGDHRLMCGDSTNPYDVEKLMADDNADLVVTDPPYNVNYGDKAEYLNEYLSKGHRNNSRILNDNMDSLSFYHFLLDAFSIGFQHSRPGAAIYVFHSENEGINFRNALVDAGWKQSQCLVWAKNNFVLGRQDYQWRHEPILYGWKEGAPHYFIDMRSLSTVIEKGYDELTKEEAIERLRQVLERSTIQEENKPLSNDVHPTMKPVPLIKKLIRNSSRENEIVLDLFGGSGTTLIAAEEMNRRCRMMEFDEHFVEVIIKRWEKQTGRKAVLLNG